MAAKTKISRKELLKRQDDFLSFSEKAIIFAREHSRFFSYIGIALVVIVVIYLGVNSYSKYINKKGQEAYNIAYYSMLKNISLANTTGNDLKKAEEFAQNLKHK